MDDVCEEPSFAEPAAVEIDVITVEDGVDVEPQPQPLATTEPAPVACAAPFAVPADEAATLESLVAEVVEGVFQRLKPEIVAQIIQELKTRNS